LQKDGFKKQSDIQILEANTMLTKKARKNTNKNLENASPSKLSQKAHLKYQKFNNAMSIRESKDL